MHRIGSPRVEHAVRGDGVVRLPFQPVCPTCGTVLRSLRRGFECRACGHVFIESMPSRMSDPPS